MKKLLPVGLLVAAALMLTACSGGSSGSDSGASSGDEGALVVNGETIASGELLAAAQAEGSMVLYDSFPEAQWRALLDVFTEDTGVEVEHVRVVTAQLYERVVSEAGSGRLAADAIGLGDITLMQDLAKRGILASVESPNAIASLDPGLYDPDHYWYTASRNAMALAYNEELVPEADVPKSYEDLLDPKWKGQIGITPISIGGSAFAAFYVMRQVAGDDYWTKLAAQDPKQYQSVTPMTQDIVRGEIPLGFTSPSVVAAARAQGSPVNSVLFAEGTPVFANLVALAANSSSPNAAKLYLEWLESKRGQQTVSEVAGEFPARDDIPHEYAGALVPSGGANIIIPPFKVWLDSRDQLTSEWESIFNG